MKKITAIAIILAGVILFTIGNTIQMYSTISILEKRLADKEHVVDTVYVKPDTIKQDNRPFGEERAEVDWLLRELPDVVPELDNIPHMEVAYNNGSDIRYGQTLVSYDSGMPKIVVYWFESKLDKKMHRLPFMDFLDNDGTVIARQRNLKSDGKTWICDTHPVDDENHRRFFFTDPNLCRNIAKKK